LRSTSGPRRGQELVFSGPRVRIGRSRDNDLILPEREPPLSSGHHAEALLDSSGVWWIIDAGSSNGTRINDIVVRRRELKNGDRLTLGDEHFAVVIGGARPSHLVWPLAATVVAAALAVMAVAVIEQLRAKPTFEEVAASAARSVFLIALEENGRRSIVGTAFAVAPGGLLATNAHVASAIARRSAIAIQGDTYRAIRVVGTVTHRDWRQGSMRDDVALVRLEAGSDAPPLPLADPSTIAALRRGAPVAAFGFPAVSTDPQRPRGRLSVDVVGDVRGEYLEVGLAIAPGTSGSPVFNQAGAVVAIVAGGDFVDAPNGETRPSGSAVNWALSASLIREMLR